MVDVPTMAEHEALAARVADLEGLAHEDHKHDAPIHYGHREGPHEVDSSSYYEGLERWVGGETRDRDGRGVTLGRSQLPLWGWTQGELQGRGLYGYTIDNDNRNQVAVYAHELTWTLLVDMTYRGFGEVDNPIGHIGVVDVAHASGIVDINTRIDDAAVHGLESVGTVRGARVASRLVAYAGNPGPGDVVEDFEFTFLKQYGGFNEGHYGAHKSGGNRQGAIYRRGIFRDGCSWLDVGSQASYEDVQFEGSEGWGLHVEIDKWYDASCPPTTASYCRFRNNTNDPTKGNRHWFEHPATGRNFGHAGNPAHLQHASITPHMGAIVVDHALLELDVGVEVGWAEWSDGREYKAPSGVRQTAEGSALRDSLIEVSHTEGERLDGMIASFHHPEWNTWERVLIRLPRHLRDVPLFTIWRGDGWDWLTVAQFIEQHAPTCTVVVSP